MKTKTLLLLLCLLFVFVANIYSQTCKNIVTVYAGPQNTSQLVYVLEKSTDQLIKKLDCSTKASLEAFVVFNNGLPIGMSGTDANIKKIYADSTYCSNLFTAIFGNKSIPCTFATKPQVKVISLAKFYQLIGGGSSGGASFSTVYSHCLNCATPNPDGSPPNPGLGECCNPPGGGCWDAITLINGLYYYVQ